MQFIFYFHFCLNNNQELHSLRLTTHLCLNNNSKAALGDGMSVEERTNLKQEVKSLTFGDVSEFMESLPSEFLTVLRTE